ncbi:MAG TPA: hypothetical protein H9675_02900 [Firmicutes bacterium]|nr:hypothetical protein [Bacillota bacterium]
MEPIIKDGSIVWVKPQVSIENGEVYSCLTMTPFASVCT